MPYQVLDSPRLSQIMFGGMLLGGILFSAALVYVLGPLGVAMLIAMAGATVSIFTHPLVPFTIYFGALFFESTVVPGIPVSVNQLVAPLFLLSVVMYALRGKALPLRFSLLPLLVCVTIYFGINGLYGEDLPNGLLYSRYIVIYLVIAVCIAVTMSRERNILALAWVIVALTGFAAAAGLYEAFEKNIFGNFAGGHWGYDVRVQGTAANPIAYGWNMVYAFPFAFLLFAEMRTSYGRGLAIFLGMLIITAATLTFNRQTFVVIAVSMVLCSLLYRYKNRSIFLGFLSVLAAITSFTILPLVIKRFLTVADLTTDHSFLERKDSFLIGLEMLKKSPITGVGFGSFPKVWRNHIPPDYTTYFAQYRAPQEEKFLDLGLMQVLVETGIIGLLLYVAVIVTIFLRSYKYRQAAIKAGDVFAQNLSSTVIVVVVFLALTSMIQDTFLYTRVWIFYGVAMLLDHRVLPLKRTNVETKSNGNLALSE